MGKDEVGRKVPSKGFADCFSQQSGICEPWLCSPLAIDTLVAGFMLVEEVVAEKEDLASELAEVFLRIIIMRSNPEPLKKHLTLPVVKELRPVREPMKRTPSGLTRLVIPYVSAVACQLSPLFICSR